MRGLDGRDPVAQRFVDRVLERRAPARDGHDVGAEALHPEHVERLALDVDRAHEHEAVEPEQCRRGGGGHAVLTRAGLGDDALFAHSSREQRLAEHVVDLVRSGVRQVFALQQHTNAETLREPVALGDRSGTTGVRREQFGELGAERVVAPCLAEVALEIDERGHERLGDESATELSEATEVDRFGPGGPERDGHAARGNGFSHRRPSSRTARPWDREPTRSPPQSSSPASRAAVMKLRSFRASLWPEPGVVSTPLQTSTPHGRTRLIACADVALVETAGEQQPHPGGHGVGEGPVERDTGTRFVGVDEHDVDGTVAHRGQRRVAGGEPLDHEGDTATHPANVGDRLAAAELRAGETERVHQLDDPLRHLVTEHADGDDTRREAVQDLGDRVGGDLARASRGEVEAEGVGAEGDGEERVLLVRDPADLDPHRCGGYRNHFGAPRTFVTRMDTTAAPVRTWSRVVLDWLPVARDRRRVRGAARARRHPGAAAPTSTRSWASTSGSSEASRRRSGCSASCGTRAIPIGTTTPSGSST